MTKCFIFINENFTDDLLSLNFNNFKLEIIPKNKFIELNLIFCLLKNLSNTFISACLN